MTFHDISRYFMIFLHFQPPKLAPNSEITPILAKKFRPGWESSDQHDLAHEAAIANPQLPKAALHGTVGNLLKEGTLEIFITFYNTFETPRNGGQCLDLEKLDHYGFLAQHISIQVSRVGCAHVPYDHGLCFSKHITSHHLLSKLSIMVYHAPKPPRVSKSQNMSESTHLVTSGSKGPKVRQNVSKFCCKQVDRHDTTLLAVPWRAISMRGALCVTFASRSLDELDELECSKDLLGSVQQSKDIKSSLEESLRIWPKTRYMYKVCDSALQWCVDLILSQLQAYFNGVRCSTVKTFSKAEVSFCENTHPGALVYH